MKYILYIIILLSFSAQAQQPWKHYAPDFRHYHYIWLDSLKLTYAKVGSNSDSALMLNRSTGRPEIVKINSGTSYTFTNGLTNSSGTVSLGGTLSSNTTISGGSQALNLGTTGSKLSGLNIVTNGKTSIFSGITYQVDATNTDADYTVPGNTIIAEISDVLSTARTLTLPTPGANGTMITLVMRYSTGINKYSLSAAITDNSTGLTFTTLDWGKTYDFFVDQTLAWRLIRKY